MHDKKKRDTVGKLAVEAQQKDPVSTDARELGGEMTKPYMKELFETLEKGKQAIPGDDFFLVVLTKREHLLKNVVRNYFFYRHTCPTPDYDQAVYHYKKGDDSVDFLWVIPSREGAHGLVENALMVDPELKELLGFVLDFKDGTLFKKAQTLNGEDKLEGRVVLEELNEKESERTRNNRK